MASMVIARLEQFTRFHFFAHVDAAFRLRPTWYQRRTGNLRQIAPNSCIVDILTSVRLLHQCLFARPAERRSLPQFDFLCVGIYALLGVRCRKAMGWSRGRRFKAVPVWRCLRCACNVMVLSH